MRAVALDFPEDRWPSKPLSWNENLHHHVRKVRVRGWRALGKEIAEESGWKARQSVRVIVEITMPTNHRRDSANLGRVAKAIVDGFVDAAMIPDDCDGILVGPDMRRVYPNGPRHIRVIVMEVGRKAFTRRMEL